MIGTFRQISKGELHYYWHSGQLRALASKARIVCVLAGTQGGKTVMGPRWLHGEICRTQSSNPDCKAGENDYLAGTANYDLLKLKMLPELIWYFEQTLRIGRYWSGDRVIELAKDLIPGQFMAQRSDDAMWGRIILRSAEASGGWESGTAKAAWLDEAGHPDFRRDAWEGANRRLSIHQGRILITTTLYNAGWLKIEVFDRSRDKDSDIEVIQFDSTLNPAFPRAEFDRAIAMLPAWKADMFYRGRYAKPAGLIYDAFNEVTCKIPRFPIPKEWPRFVGHDFGGANPAAVFLAEDPGTGYFYLYHEYLPGGGRSTAQHVEQFKQLTVGVNVLKRAGGSHQEDEIRQGYTAHGWPIQAPKIKDVELGIDRVYGLMKLNKLFIFSDMFNLLDELSTYSRKLDKEFNPTDEIEDKAKYHLLDALRYILSDFTPETVMQGSASPIRNYA